MDNIVITNNFSYGNSGSCGINSMPVARRYSDHDKGFSFHVDAKITKDGGVVMPVKTRRFALGLASLSLVLLALIAGVSGVILFLPGYGIDLKFIGVVALLSSIFSIVFVWYNVFYEGLRGNDHAVTG